MSTIIGLDIGHYSIKALRLEVAYRGFRATGYDEEVLDTVIAVPEVAVVDSPDGEGGEPVITEAELEAAIHEAEDEAMHVALAALAERGALEGESIAVAIPPDLVLTSRMAFPFDDPRQLQMVIPAQIEERIPTEVDELLLDHHVIGPSNAEPGQNDVLVTAAKHEDMEVFLDIWRGGGVDPHWVLMGDAVMMHLAGYLLGELNEPCAIVDIGHKFTRIACIEPAPQGAKAGVRLGGLRTIQYGGHNLTLALQQAFSCSYQEAEQFKHTRASLGHGTMVTDAAQVRASDVLESALGRIVRDLRATLHAHMAERRVSVSRVYLCGGTSLLPNLAPFIEAQLGLPVSPLPVAGEELAELESLGNERSALVATQALALALREVMPREKVNTINFRRGRFEHQGKKSWLRGKLIGLAVIGGMLLLALTMYFVSRYAALSAQVEATDNAVMTATGRLFEKPTTDLDKIKRELKDPSSDEGLLPKYSAYDMYYELNHKIPAGTKVELYDVRIDLVRQLIKVEGQTDSAATVDQIVIAYEEFECFKGQVKKGEVEAVGDEVKFALNISPQCTPDKNDKKKKK